MISQKANIWTNLIIELLFYFIFLARVEKILLEGVCEQCIGNQLQKVEDWATLFVEKQPELFRAAMAKYAENLGIPIPSDERRKMIQILGTYP